MQIVISLDRADARRWLLRLADHMREAGHTVSFRLGRIEGEQKSDIGMLLALETRVFGSTCSSFSRIPHDDLPIEVPGIRPDLTLDISGGMPADLSLYLDGRRGISHLGATLVGEHVPFVELRDQAGHAVASGLPAIEAPDVASRALDQFLSRLVTLVLMAIDGKQRTPANLLHLDREAAPGSPATFLARSALGKLARKLFASRLRADHWRVGIRRATGPLDYASDTVISGYAWLPDDGERYYADPVLWTEAGRTYLFVEEFPYATGRGIIAYTELDDDGRPLFVPRPIIERRTHLSYPMIFRHDGSLYMIPENSAEDHVPLYRAARFPDVWDYLGPLLPDVGLHDATLFEHAGAWWLFGNQALHGGSSWDCLMIFRAESPLGPFEPHAANPVLVDARATRPGGPILKMGEKLIRPVQNCLGGYGRFLRFIEITELSPQTYAQHECGRLAAPVSGPIQGVHTYARSDRFEAIDVLTSRRFIG